MQDMRNEGEVGMTIALWIIAACEIIRALQNFAQLEMVRRDQSAQGDLYERYATDIREIDRELSEFLMMRGDKEDDGK